MRVAIKTLGCRQNQCESDAIQESLRRDGHTAVGPDDAADLFIINTCSVTQEADADSRQMIRRAVRRNPSARVVVTGCYAQIAAGEIAAIPGVALVAGNGEKAQLSEMISGLREQSSPLIAVSDIQQSTRFAPLPPPIGATRSRALLKVQDGCSYRCTFCIVPETRGPNRSQSTDAVLRDLRVLVDAGYPEVVLTGTHLGTYGRDLSTGSSIAGLVADMLETAAPARLRLSSLDPHEVGEELIGCFGRFENLCRHLHLPVQSGDETVLKRMRRPHTADDFRRLVERLAETVPGIAIGTDVIVGFPGEGDAEFEQTYRLLDRLPIAYLHVFNYSQRRGTVAAVMPNHVPKDVRAARSAALRALSDAKWRAFRQTQVGQSFAAVVLEGRDAPTGRLDALTDNYITVQVERTEESVGRMVALSIETVTERETIGRLQRRCANDFIPTPEDK
ncbi:MAG: tRNA (N(6)-L-threonylcarbamoyladenosine(37)-C(2))-methylthiotransferase MtaB [Candidatus Methylomirabilis oxygeniifera]|uniref:tRNA 2-methylthioadenosine synthase-like protein n=1 Tax=Methylomirabilis oxygeniifera TaxID=671143 RepID=D5MEU4_METO1|nr:MAG: tRNA (N(6)-L-threonylcarbamoyladenosine(37)-C(2))-methylthiotransferase MtaB [Candidatus Methylomirabilis oxyfera]CBE68273.1 tRNA 2-methylthioadenosine synthase-like protein [Candidatus Methylomirabilis oxyfera]